MKHFLTTTAALCLLASTSPAAIVYDTHFTDADGFTEGGYITGTDGWLAQGGGTSVGLRSFDVTGAGELRFDQQWLRGYNTNTATVFGVGDTILVTAAVRLGISGAADQYLPSLQFGVSGHQAFSHPLLGTGLTQLGATLSAGPAVDPNLYFAAGLNGANDNSTLMFPGALTNYTTNPGWFAVEVTKSAVQDEFNLTLHFGGNTSSGTFTNASLYDASEVHLWVNAQASNLANTEAYVDYISFDYTAVPEPSTMALLAGLATMGLVLVRRRRL